MSGRPFNNCNISTYAQVAIGVKLVEPLLIKLSTVLLGGVFIGIVFGIHVTMVGIYQKDYETIAVVVGVLSVCVCGLAFQLKLGCVVFQASRSVVRSWNMDRTKGVKKDAYKDKLFRSLKPLALPAGNIGVIDEEIAMNYYENLLHYILDVVIYTSELFAT